MIKLPNSYNFTMKYDLLFLVTSMINLGFIIGSGLLIIILSFILKAIIQYKKNSFK